MRQKIIKLHQNIVKWIKYRQHVSKTQYFKCFWGSESRMPQKGIHTFFIYIRHRAEGRIGVTSGVESSIHSRSSTSFQV